MDWFSGEIHLMPQKFSNYKREPYVYPWDVDLGNRVEIFLKTERFATKVAIYK
jgi:hypothetical protein